jgi:hypothetical protein
MFWTPAFAGVTIQETFYETIKFKGMKAMASSDLAANKMQAGILLKIGREFTQMNAETNFRSFFPPHPPLSPRGRGER